MYAVVGILFLAAAAVVSAWTYAQFHRLTPPSWTGRELMVLAIKLAKLTLLTAGLALFERHMLRIGEQPFGLAELVLIAAFATAFVVSVALICKSWRARRRRRGMVQARDLSRPMMRRELPAGFSPRRRRNAKPQQRRAASRGKRLTRRDAA